MTEMHAVNTETDSPAVDKPSSPERQDIYTGILPYQAIKQMVDGGEVKAAELNGQADLKLDVTIEPDQIQPASIDLRLGSYAYPIDASFLPGKQRTVFEKMAQLDPDYNKFKISLKDSAVLERGRLYVIPLLEEVSLNRDTWGFANPKSSTGRLDILTRLITDEGESFDHVRRNYKGRLYVEVAPQTFSIVVKTGTRLNQLRFRRARGATTQFVSYDEWKRLIESKQVVDTAPNGKPILNRMLEFTVDLIGDGTDGCLIGWKAKKHTQRIDLERRDYDCQDFWEPICFHKSSTLILDPNEFYILMTKEAVAVPPEYAAEMLPSNSKAGEFRVHYAGFFDPGFGWDLNTHQAGSSRGVLEVRSHEVPFLLEHGQTVGWLRYEKMAAPPEKLYGHDNTSNYQGQSLKLAKQFKEIRL